MKKVSMTKPEKTVALYNKTKDDACIVWNMTEGTMYIGVLYYGEDPNYYVSKTGTKIIYKSGDEVQICRKTSEMTWKISKYELIDYMEKIAEDFKYWKNKRTERSLKTFPTYGKAKETLEKLMESGKIDQFETTIRERYPHGVSDQRIEDILANAQKRIYDLFEIYYEVENDENQ